MPTYTPPPRAENVGVIAADVYFPSTYVAQEELEKCDGVAAGKYTIGLGQEAMAVCDSREDINSICLTVVHSIMEKYGIPWDQIGRLEVGTETLVDKSKSVKSTLMQLFEERGCHDIEGVDTINACYGGTSALFNALAWTESSAWDGRYALVIAADIAVYDRGAARPTGGVGAVAMLVGPDAPLVIEPGLRGTHMEHAFDFYKPQMVSEYPTVDGHLSNECYIRALDNCYNRYAARFEQQSGRSFSLGNDVDFAIFHQPYAKLVQKSWARLTWNDFLVETGADASAATGPLAEHLHLAGTPESMVDRPLEKASVAESKETFTDKVAPSMQLGKQVGNSYCGSLYNGMASLVDAHADDGLDGTNGNGDEPFQEKRVLMFSYGSGLAASMFSVKVRKPVHHIKHALNLQQRLGDRVALEPEIYHDTVDQREKDYTKFDYEPDSSVEHYFPGTYYLDKVDELHRRSYTRAPREAADPIVNLNNHKSTPGGLPGNVDLYVKPTGQSATLGTRGMSMFTQTSSSRHHQHQHRVRSNVSVSVVDSIADPFNMSLGDGQAFSGNMHKSTTSRGFRSTSTVNSTTSTVADPFNMDSSMQHGHGMGEVDVARNAARAAHMKQVVNFHSAQIAPRGTRGVHTLARSLASSLRYLK